MRGANYATHIYALSQRYAEHNNKRELMNPKPVGEAEIDQLLYDVERICDPYAKAGSEEDPNLNKWVKDCIMQNLPDRVAATLALQLKHAESVEEMQYLVAICYMTLRRACYAGNQGQCYF